MPGRHIDPSHITGAVGAFVKKNAVCVIAFAAALITSFIVPPDAEYLSYPDFKTLACLFAVLATVCALKNVSFFFVLARRVVSLFGNMRLCALALVYVTFVGSMLIANDMALLTFLPLGWLVLEATGRKKEAAPLFILQNIAANLGGMLTPFGNPQNLYLYGRFQIPDARFALIMAPSFALSVALITVCCLVFFKNEPLSLEKCPVKLPALRTAAYIALFALSIVMVFRVIPYWIGLAVVAIALFFLDRKALSQVDYPLLFTFLFFFIFSGNMSRIEPVRDLLTSLLEKNTLVFSALSCQFISNVPSAVLLSRFTENYPALLVGVNIGGTGTLIASLASLITFREYMKHFPGRASKYVALFSAFNFSFLGSLILFNSIFPPA